jgi:hypothetical protein
MIIIGLALLFKKKSDKAKSIVIYVLVGLVFLFEISRRTINIIKEDNYTIDFILYTLLPRPWCAISCWTLIIASIFRKKFIYNTACISSLLCAIIYFAYPGAGFNNKYILYENLYSISTHSLLLIISILLMVFKKTEFKYKNLWKVAVSFMVLYAYGFFEIYALDISTDPMYFMPEGDIQHILGITYPTYLTIYILFVFVYTNIFFIIDDKDTIKTQYLRLKNELLYKRNNIKN